MALLITDRVCLKLDDDGDLVVPLQFVSGLEAAAQGARIRTNMLRGEWFRNRLIGIPLLPTDDGLVTEAEAILGEDFDANKARAAYRDALLFSAPGVRAPGVLGLAKLDVTYDNATRVLAVTWQLKTIWGDTDPDTLVKDNS